MHLIGALATNTRIALVPVTTIMETQTDAVPVHCNRNNPRVQESNARRPACNAPCLLLALGLSLFLGYPLLGLGDARCNVIVLELTLESAPHELQAPS